MGGEITALELLENLDLDDLIMSATAYYLGRTTASVDQHCSGIVKSWGHLNEHTREFIQQIVERAFTRDDHERAFGLEPLSLGHDCDRESWERVRACWQLKNRKQ